MAFRWRSGAELQSVVAAVEFTAVRTNAPTIETTLQRSGLAAYRIANAAGAEGFNYTFGSVSGNEVGNFFSRFYLYIVALPTLTSTLGGFSAGTSPKVTIRITAAGALQLFNAEDNAQVGSDSSALSTATWYRIEMNLNSTTLSATAVEAKIDGTAFASGTVDLIDEPTSFGCYTIAGDNTLDYIVDDLGVNDDVGAFENTYCGEGEIFHLYPNGNGDNSAWAGNDGNSTDNYLLVDEFPPDDATTYVESNTSGQIDDYDIQDTPAAMGSTDTVNCVAVGIRVAVSDATAGDPDVVTRFKAASGGTVEESASLDVNSTTYLSPRPNAAPNTYPLIVYDMPGASTTGITKADLDQSQIGIRESATDTHFVRVSLIWLLVDHKPGVAAKSLLWNENAMRMQPLIVR